MSDLEARIAAALADHEAWWPSIADGATHCDCGQWKDDSCMQTENHRAHVAAMLVPVIAGVLRETSKAAAERNDDIAPDYECAEWAKWITERADKLERS